MIRDNASSLSERKIEVEDALRPGSKRQTRPLVAMQKFDGAAMFFATQDGDQAVVMGLIA